MGITTKDLAQMCQVSRTTVHRALTDTGRINEATRAMILNTVEEFGYRPDLLARGLVKGKSMYIGVLVMDVNNRYFAQMLSAISVEAKKRKYFINIALHERNQGIEKEQLRRLTDYHMDGIILSSINEGETYRKFIESLDIPIVTIDNKIAEGIPFVGIEEKEASIEAVQHILQKDYEKVVYVFPPMTEAAKENLYVHNQRLEGFEEEMARVPKKTAVVIKAENFLEECYRELKKGEEKTAFFCSADIFALELMMYLQKKGLKAAEDYGIMGFDDIDTLQYVTPRLTSIYNGVEEVANTAVNLLFDLIDAKRVETECILPYRFVEGETL